MCQVSEAKKAYARICISLRLGAYYLLTPAMKYQPHVTFSAQALAFRSLMKMYEKIRDGESEPYDYLPIIVFTAFSIESYINSLGARKIPLWKHLERLPWKSKIDALHESVNATADWGANPLQFASEIFRIRDQLAHGKPETVAGPICADSQTAASILHVQHLKPTILKYLNKEWIIASSKRLYKLLEHLGSLFGLQNDDFATFSTSRIERHDDSRKDF